MGMAGRRYGMVLMGLAGCCAALASGRPGAPMPGLTAGPERKVPAGGAGDPGAETARNALNQHRLALQLERGLEAKFTNAELALATAQDRLRRAEDLAEAAKAEVEVSRLDADRARILGALQRARKAAWELRSAGAAGAPETDGPGGAAGTSETKEDPGAGNGAPGPHPFFSPSDRLRPGQVLRYALPRGGGADGIGRAAKLVACGDGTLAWLNEAGTAVGVLRPGGRPQRLRLPEGKDAGGVFFDLAADQDTLWILGRFPGQGYAVAAFAKDGTGRTYVLPEDAQREPVVMALAPADRVRGPWILTPDHLNVLHLGGDRNRGFWKTWEHRGETAARRGDQAFLDGPILYRVSPGDGRLAWMEFDVAKFTFHDGDLAGGRAAGFAFSGSDSYDAWGTDPGSDRIIRVSRGSLKNPRSLQLAKGAAPSAIALGPLGHMVFATAHGFGLVTPAGDAVRLPHQGPPVAAIQLVPAPAAGKIYFLEAGKPYLQALVLPWAQAGAGTPAWAQGPSLLADRQAAAEEPAAETKVETPKPSSRAATGAGAAGDEEPQPAGPEAPPTAKVVWPWDGRGETAGADAGAATNLVHNQITSERMDHIFDEHDYDPDTGAGWAKGQFLPATARELAQMLVAGANGDGVEERYEGNSDRVLEFRAPREIGRVRLAEAKDWQPTQRVRVVLRMGWDRQRNREREYLASAYPVAEIPEGKAAAGR